jgi:hypothetical protein
VRRRAAAHRRGKRVNAPSASVSSGDYTGRKRASQGIELRASGWRYQPERRHDGERRLGIDGEVVQPRGSKGEGGKRRASILTPPRCSCGACSMAESGGGAAR